MHCIQGHRTIHRVVHSAGVRESLSHHSVLRGMPVESRGSLFMHAPQTLLTNLVTSHLQKSMESYQFHLLPRSLPFSLSKSCHQNKQPSQTRKGATCFGHRKHQYSSTAVGHRYSPEFLKLDRVSTPFHLLIQGQEFTSRFHPARSHPHSFPLPQSSRRHVSCYSTTSDTSLEELSPKQWDQVSAYVDLLQEWNQKMNLTAVTGREAIMSRHVEDSLSLLPLLDAHIMEQGITSPNGSLDVGDVTLASQRATLVPGAVRLIDVGTGAGLPGLILAIARPAWQVTLLDSLNKRCTFLCHVASSLPLPNVTVLCARAEDAGTDPTHREQYQAVVARAVAEMRVLAELCLPLASVGGVFIAAKGPDPKEEVEGARKAVGLLGGALVEVVEMGRVQGEGERNLTCVVYRKVSSTPAKYPRRPGTPSKRPL